MDKMKFLYRLQDMFTTLKDRNFESVKEEYDTVLNDCEIDYQKLYNIFCTEWDKSCRPLPSDLKKFISRARMQKTSDLKDDVKQELVKVAQWFNSPDYQCYHKAPPDYILTAIRRNNFTSEMINQMMLSCEVCNAYFQRRN